MDSDSDSPFNYSWPSFPKMRMRRKMGKKGKGFTGRVTFSTSFPSSSSFLTLGPTRSQSPDALGKELSVS